VKVFVEPSFALPLVSMSVAFRAGSVSDPKGKEGLARITARMLRRGGGGLTSAQIEETIDCLGGEFASDVGLSWTSLGMEVIERNLDAFIDRVASVIGEPAFDEGELKKLLREAEGELIESRDNDRLLSARAVRRGLFGDHLYGRRAGGYVESLRSITRDDVVAYYKRHYNRANAVAAVSGYVGETRAHSLIERLMSRLPEGEPTPDPVDEPARKPGRRLVFVDKPERSQVQMFVACLGTTPHDADHTPLLVANTIFGGTFTARLMYEIRSKHGWSYGAYSRLGVERHREAFSISTAPAAHQAGMCLSREIELFEEWHDSGVTEQELAFTQSYLGRSHVFEVDTAQKRVHQKLDAAVFELPDGYHEGYVDRVRAVTKAQADEAVRSRLTPPDLVIAVVGTHAEIGAAIEGAIPGLTETTVVPFDLE
jgi:zinc protease